MSWESYGPTEDRLAAVKNFSMPAKPSITDIRSWFGLVNQLAPFLATAPVMAPFRELLKKRAVKTVYWDEQLDTMFKQSKEIICQLAKDGLAYFDCTRPTMAITDWSKEGIGFIVLQQYCACTSSETPFCCKGGWRLALCGSRHLTSTEAGYAPVEGEALAVVWCLRKAKLFLIGCPNLTLVTDHKPLVKLFDDKELKDIENPRLLAMKEKTLAYSFVMKYLPGKKNPADFLSRYPALRTNPDSSDEDLAALIETVTIAAVVDTLHSEYLILDEEEIQRIASEDPVYQNLMAKVMTNDWHDKKSREAPGLRPYYSIRDRLAVVNNLVIYTYDQGPARIVIPEAMRNKVATNLHAGHQGLDSMQRRARQSVYWPGIDGDLSYHRSSCESCNRHAPSQPAEPLILTPAPEYPFQKTVADLFIEEGHRYMAYADRLTGWVEMAHLPNDTTSNRLKDIFRLYFSRWGAPEELSTDGGTNLVSDEMTSFFKRWGVNMRISSAYYPQSNGRAEAAVKTAKRLLRDNVGANGSLNTDRMSIALLQYRNTPLRGSNRSPAQLIAGRQLRDGVPAVREHYKIQQVWYQDIEDRKTAVAEAHEKILAGRGVQRTLDPIAKGCRVFLQNPVSKEWDRSGTVTEALENRQYLVRLDVSGRISRRNRVHMRVVNRPPPSTPVTSPDTTVTRRTQRTRRATRQPQRLGY